MFTLLLHLSYLPGDRWSLPGDFRLCEGRGQSSLTGPEAGMCVFSTYY
jgi:hypothetical protein